MGNIIAILCDIFMLKEDNSTKIGLSCFKESRSVVEKPKPNVQAPKELKLSELMRKSSC